MTESNISKLFCRRIIRPGTWHICGQDSGAATYLLIGNACALVIDPGYTKENLRDYIEHVTEHPLIVCNTHGKFDHTGANGQFADRQICMSAHATVECKFSFPWHNFKDYNYQYTPTVIDDGFLFDLGNRTIETIKMNCHSLGSLLFLDHKERILFSGDEIKCGCVMIHTDEPGASVERYLSDLKKLNARRAEFDMICPAYDGTPVHASLIDTLMENCMRILSGIPGETYEHDKFEMNIPGFSNEMVLPSPDNLVSEWKGTFIVYKRNRIYETEK